MIANRTTSFLQMDLDVSWTCHDFRNSGNSGATSLASKPSVPGGRWRSFSVCTTARCSQRGQKNKSNECSGLVFFFGVSVSTSSNLCSEACSLSLTRRILEVRIWCHMKQRLLWLLTIWESSDQVIWNDPKCTKCMNSNFIDDYHRLSLHYMPLPLRLLYPWIISMAPRKLGLVPPSMRHGWHGLYLKARGEWYRCSMNHSSNRLTRLAKFLQMSVSQIFHTNVASEFQNQNVLNDRQKSLGWRITVPPFLCTFRGANFAHWQACPMASGGNPGPID